MNFNNYIALQKLPKTSMTYLFALCKKSYSNKSLLYKKGALY